MKLSDNFTLNEMIRSNTAVRLNIDQTPSQLVIDNLRALCVNTLEPLRYLVKQPINVNSGYRSERLNKAVKGSKTSQHLIGQAADITVSSMPIEYLFKLIINSDIPFDQVIQEFDTWIHISFNPLGNRNQALRAIKVNGRTKYISR